MPNNIAINIENLYKTYHKQNAKISALDGISLQIPQGSFFVIGGKWSRKSTLINILADLLKDAGKITVFDQDFDLNKTAAVTIGIVPQLVLDPFFTVREVLEIFVAIMVN